jgi:hypothetical protein
MVTVELGRAMALLDVVAAARVVVLLDGTDRVSLTELREALAAYDQSTGKNS